MPPDSGLYQPRINCTSLATLACCATAQSDLVIEADFSSVYQALPGILISLTEAGLQVGAADGSGRLSYSQSKAFAASVPEEKMFSLVFSWPDSEAARQSVMSGRSILPLSIYIRGTQHV